MTKGFSGSGRARLVFPNNYNRAELLNIKGHASQLLTLKFFGYRKSCSLRVILQIAVYQNNKCQKIRSWGHSTFFFQCK